MRNNKVILKVDELYQNGFIKMFCFAQAVEINREDKIIGVAIAKKENTILNKDEKVIIVENNKNLTKEILVKKFLVAPDEHLKLEMLQYNKIENAVKNKQIRIIPFTEVEKEYNKYTKRRELEKLRKTKETKSNR